MDTSPSDKVTAVSPAITRRTIRPHPWIAWFVVLLVAATTIVLQSIDVADPIADGVVEGDQAVDVVEPSNIAGLGDTAMVTVQGRPLLGMMTLLDGSTDSQTKDLLENPQPVQQIRGWILVGVDDPDRAILGLRKLASLDHTPTLVAAAARDAASAIGGQINRDRAMLGLRKLASLDHTPILVAAAARDAAAAIGEEPTFDEAHLRTQLGWFGTLAWAIGSSPAELETMKRGAKTVIMVLGIGLCFLVLAALTGLVLGIVALVKISDGSLRSGLASPDRLHGLYAETFAVWLVLLNVLSIAAAIIAQGTGVTQFTALLVFFPASLCALAWPSLRGSTFARTCADIGWTRGRGVVREIGAGIVGWMGMLPIQLIGIVCTVVLMWMAGVADGDSDAPTHPIIDALGDPFAVFTAFMVAVVLAPIVEETVFRGLLYRQLRSVSAFRRGAVSVLASALITGLLFAAIHPQGVLAIPALMSIAIAVALAREWRGSLIAPVLMHGINNALAVTAMVIIIAW